MIALLLGAATGVAVAHYTAPRRNPVRAPMHVQSLLFPRDRFTRAKAKAWARAHGYRADAIDVTAGYFRLRQWDPAEGRLFRTILFGKSGIKAVVGR